MLPHMAIGESERTCTIVLHDDAISTEDVLCGANILLTGDSAYLVASGARTLCIQAKRPATNPDSISVHISVAKLFGFENRMKGSVRAVHDFDGATATHVEVLFRDQHLSRADMWRMKSQIDLSVLHENQNLLYLGSQTGRVETIYTSGQEVLSAFVAHPRTNLIFRSISARFTFMIQISKEMLEDWNDTDLMYESMITGFLPELFCRWDQLKVRHQVSVVLFGRRLSSHSQQGSGDDLLQAQPDDFFHTVVLDSPSGEWRGLLRKLKKAFNDNNLPRQVSLAAEGNMLEAIHMAGMDFSAVNLDPRLASTGTSIVAITAGPGLFQASHKLLKSTTDLFIGSNTGVDIVALSPKPLHPVPLFQYTRGGRNEYALPHWLDISYWSSNSDARSSQWRSGAMSQEVKGIKVPRLARDHAGSGVSSSKDQMDLSDEQAFCSPLVFTEPLDTISRALSSNVPIETNGTLARLGQLLPSSTNAPVKILPPVVGEIPRSKVLSFPTTQPAKGAKRDATHPHALMQTDRKISLGPRGLAPSLGVASTTVSAPHVQQAKDTPLASSFTANETTSGLAKQIKDSLRGKPSNQSVLSHALPDSAEPTNPVSIPATQEKTSANLRDPASLMEEAVMRPMSQSVDDSPDSLSATPKAQPGTPTASNMSATKARSSITLPWLTLMNPCNPRRANMQVASEFRQWQNVFPRAVSSDVVKWKSLCSPATLPLLAEGRVSLNELEKRFTKKIRRVLATVTSGSNKRPAQQAMWQMISLRLSAGFQIVPSRTQPKGQMPGDLLDRVLLSLGSQYHEVCTVSDSEVQIAEYERPSVAENSADDTDESTLAYSVKLKPAISTKETPVQIGLQRRPAIHDWSRLDDQCVNGTALADDGGLCQTRFVLVPGEPPRTGGLTSMRELSDEERRLEGIQKLTQTWQRHRYFNEEDQRHQGFMIKAKTSASAERDPNPLAIEYQTRDSSAVVGALGINLTGQMNDDSTMRLFPESEQYHSSNFDMSKLVKQMQEAPPNGVDLRDRGWFGRFHRKAFRGDEMINWLLRVFKDLHTREDAVALGNQLIGHKIFTHVNRYHEFRDGHYLYQISAAHRTTDYPDSGGFFSKPLGRSVPSTPSAEQKHSPSNATVRAEPDSSENMRTPVLVPSDHKKKKAVLLSQKLQYNVDSGGKSSQLEIVNLHYDRIHNPENCYHIWLDWTNTTPKLIRESVARWSALVEGHGLKLVQLPVQEAGRIHDQHPFDQTVSIKLAVRPPEKSLNTPQLDPQPASTRHFEDLDRYHKGILRRCDFALDLESAHSFPSGVDVSYSWGRPDYEHTQFVHKTGLLLVQIVNRGDHDFLLLPNRLAQHSTIATNKKTELASVETIVQNFVSFCRNKKALLTAFEEINRPKAVAPSPFANALGADNDVPPMELPQNLAPHRTLLKHAD